MLIHTVHFHNDFLIACWIMTFCLVCALIACIGLLWRACVTSHTREIFDYAAGLIDLLLNLLGSMYYVAGSYNMTDSSKAQGKHHFCVLHIQSTDVLIWCWYHYSTIYVTLRVKTLRMKLIKKYFTTDFISFHFIA